MMSHKDVPPRRPVTTARNLAATARVGGNRCVNSVSEGELSLTWAGESELAFLRRKGDSGLNGGIPNTHR